MSIKIYKTRLLEDGEDNNGVFTDIDHYVAIFGEDDELSVFLKELQEKGLSKTWNKPIKNPKRNGTDTPSQEAKNVVDTFLNLLDKSKDIDLTEPFLKEKSLYTTDRVSKMDDFFYTAKILSVLSKDSKLRKYYPKITPDQMKELRDKVGGTTDYPEIKPTGEIRKIIIDADKKYASGETTTFKDVFGSNDEYFADGLSRTKLRQSASDTVATLAKLKDFDADENTADILSRYSDSDKDKFESLMKFASNALSNIKNAQYDESDSDNAVDANQKSFDNAYRRTQGFSKFFNVISQFDKENIANAKIDDFVKLLRTQEQEQPQEPQPQQNKIVYRYGNRFLTEIPPEEAQGRKSIILQ